MNNNVRVSFTMDTWTSIQNINYMVLIAYFVDGDWILQKRIIIFVKFLTIKVKPLGG